MSIRLMTAADYDGAAKLWNTIPGMGLNTLDDSREGIEKFLLRNPETCFVAEENGEITGTILAGHDGRRGYIYHTAVRSGMQGKGTGSALVAAALKALKAQGIAKVALVCFADNESGNAFWEKRGFEARGDLVYRNKRIIEI